MNFENRKIENLVFEGGGVKGSAYAGCMQVLDEYGLLAPVRRVAGTSAGSITATLLAIGAGSKGLTESILDTQFSSFVYDRWGLLGDLWRVLFRYGFHTGNGFDKVLKRYLKKYTGNEALTFVQLDKMATENPEKYKHLSVVASNISTQQIHVFDCVKTPDVPIWQAVRCSMSIPFLFEPFKLLGDYYMDGGLGWVYPIDIYDQKISKFQGHTELPDVDRNMATLGFYLEPEVDINDPGFKPPRMNIHSLKTTVEAAMDFMMNTANASHMHPVDRQRTVFIDDLGVSATDFDISKEMIKKLIASGRRATEEYFAKQASPQV